MAFHIRAPRVNNNDDTVRVRSLLVGVGDAVEAGQLLGEIETDKATVTIEADRSGFVLKVNAAADDIVLVGSSLLILGEDAGETLVEEQTPADETNHSSGLREPTTKARILLSTHGLNAAEIPVRGPRITVEDVESYLASRDRQRKTAPHEQPPPTVAEGRQVQLTMDERGMLRSVLWHRDEAVPAYLEIEYDHRYWDKHAQTYAAEQRLLSSPLLALMAHRLVMIGAKHPKLNSTIMDGHRYVYDHVNLGFTVQVAERLYLLVVREAEGKDAPGFIGSLNRLHRNAVAQKLRAADVVGATLAFSSMERWRPERHMPILPPYVSLMVAHTIGASGRAVLGGTYDHRVLSGGDVVNVLHDLSRPEQERGGEI